MVVLAWIIDKPLSLLFDPFESITLFLSVLLANYTMQGECQAARPRLKPFLSQSLFSCRLALELARRLDSDLDVHLDCRGLLVRSIERLRGFITIPVLLVSRGDSTLALTTAHGRGRLLSSSLCSIVPIISTFDSVCSYKCHDYKCYGIYMLSYKSLSGLISEQLYEIEQTVPKYEIRGLEVALEQGDEKIGHEQLGPSQLVQPSVIFVPISDSLTLNPLVGLQVVAKSYHRRVKQFVRGYDVTPL